MTSLVILICADQFEITIGKNENVKQKAKPKIVPGISRPPHEQSGNKHTSFLHFAAVLSGIGCGYNGSGRDGGLR